MLFKKIILILILIFTILPFNKTFGATNAGFVPANIWYSKDPFEDGDKIKIYTLVFNPDLRELSGNVIFFDNTVFLGKKDFTIPAKSVKDISIDWKVEAGEHTIFAKIENAKFLISSGKYEDVYLAENETEKSKNTVSKKIIPKISDLNTVAKITDLFTPNLNKAENLIIKNTPDYIKEPVINATNSVEIFRQDMGIKSQNKKTEIQNELKNSNTNTKNNITSKTQNKTEDNKLLKPLKYIELFFYTMLSFVLNNKFVFYILIVIIIFLIIKFIWHKIHGN